MYRDGERLCVCREIEKRVCIQRDRERLHVER